MEQLFSLIIPAFVGIISYIITSIIAKALDRDFKVEEEVREIQRKRYEEFIDEMEEALQIGLEGFRNPEKALGTTKLIQKN